MSFKKIVGASIIAGSLAVSSLAGAAVTFDSDAGTGFVGKGDVQLAYGWNNKQLQANAEGVSFSYSDTSTVVTEVTWECTNGNNDKIQERERTTTSDVSTVGLVSSVARFKNQFTGYNLNGWDGPPTVSSTSSTEGPAPDSCPSGPWSLTMPAGDPVKISNVSSGGGLSVNYGDIAVALPNTPVVVV